MTILTIEPFRIFSCEQILYFLKVQIPNMGVAKYDVWLLNNVTGRVVDGMLIAVGSARKVSNLEPFISRLRKPDSEQTSSYEMGQARRDNH